MNLNKKQRLVYLAILSNPEAVNDDAVLIATVWRMEGWDDTRSLEYNIRRLTRPETITRRRRELIMAGLVKPSQAAQERREDAFRSELHKHSNNEAISWLYDEE